MRVLGVVPVRGGSKRVFGKNLRPLGGAPLMLHCLRTARAATRIDRLVVTTEDDTIASLAQASGFEVIPRPAVLAEDDTPTFPVIRHAVTHMEQQGFSADIVLTIQATYPFLTTKNIDDTVQAFAAYPDVDSVTTVSAASFRFHPYNARIVNDDGSLSFMFPEKKALCPNSQAAPPVYYFGNLYGTRRRTLDEKGSLYGDRSAAVVIDPVEAFDIDDPLDFEVAEGLMRLRTGKARHG